MEDRYKKRRETLIKKFGSEEKLTEYYRELQKKSRKNYKGTGGFAGMDKEKARKIQSMGGKKRWQSNSS